MRLQAYALNDVPPPLLAAAMVDTRCQPVPPSVVRHTWRGSRAPVTGFQWSVKRQPIDGVTKDSESVSIPLPEEPAETHPSAGTRVAIPRAIATHQRTGPFTVQ
jgi:hypothetical protein